MRLIIILLQLMVVGRSDLRSIGKQDKGGGLPPLTVVCSYTEGTGLEVSRGLNSALRMICRLSKQGQHLEIRPSPKPH